jgi:hypothetical protein
LIDGFKKAWSIDMGSEDREHSTGVCMGNPNDFTNFLGVDCYLATSLVKHFDVGYVHNSSVAIII